jgi:DNA primase
MKMDDTNAFNTMNTGRTVEYHFAIGPNTKLTWIDLDPKEQFPWEDLKQLALDLTLELRKNPECKGVEVRFSGGDGFHIYCHLTSEVATATAREEMKAFLEGFINRRKDDRLTTDATKEPTKARLDYSTIRDKGGLRMAHSLAYPTGLACTPLKETDILKFDKEMAKVV